MGSCAAPSAKGDDKFITTDYLQQCPFKYISSAFNPRLSATLFLIGFNLSKQLSGVVLSAWVGRMYDTVGFHQAYLILGCITLSFTLLSFVTLRGGNRLLPTAETQSPA